MISEKHITLAAKLYKCRDTVRRFWGAEYPGKIKRYQQIIIAAMAKHQCDEIHAVIKICEIPVIKDDGMAITMFMAACCETLEPSNQ